MVNPKEKEALQRMWGQSQTAGQDIPDGTYQFHITGARFHMSDKGRPQFKIKVKVTGGAEEYLGKEMEINDNLETPENMGWFKKKLNRLNISVPEDFDEIVDGTLAEQLVGKVFEGQAKTKNDFLNVYVNRLLGEKAVGEDSYGKASGKAQKAAAEEEETSEPEAEDSGSALGEGDAVKWNGKTGTIIESMDDGKYRVKASDGKTYRVDGKLLSPAEDEEEAEEGTVVDTEESTGLELPSPEEVVSLPATEVKRVLKELGLDAAKVKTPRVVLHGFSTLANDPAGKIELTEIAPLADALGVSIKKGTPPKDAVKALSKAVQAIVG